MKFTHLLAKSAGDENFPRREETLAGHMEHVIDASMVLYESLAEGLQELLGPDFRPDLFRTH